MTYEESFGYYLSGFVDGEGSFILTLQKQHGREHPRAIFQIILRNDDIEILEQIQQYLNCGKIYFFSRKGRSNSCPYWKTAHYVVYKPDDLYNIVIPHFETYPLRAKKARDFVIWEQGVSLIYSVNKKPQVGGYGNGPLTKWSNCDRELFSTLSTQLKDIRQNTP